jgi:hypothetical protein
MPHFSCVSAMRLAMNNQTGIKNDVNDQDGRRVTNQTCCAMLQQYRRFHCQTPFASTRSRYNKTAALNNSMTPSIPNASSNKLFDAQPSRSALRLRSHPAERDVGQQQRELEIVGA